MKPGESLVIVSRGPDGLIAAIYAREEISTPGRACPAWGALLQQTSEVRNLSDILLVFLVAGDGRPTKAG